MSHVAARINVIIFYCGWTGWRRNIAILTTYLGIHTAISSTNFALLCQPALLSHTIHYRQVNRYEAGGKYEPHVDWARSSVAEQEWTVLLCLSSVADDQGGETVFPRAGIMVQPKEGMAIVFRNNLRLNVLDPESLHGGVPLLYGEKWNSNQWIFAQDVSFARRVSLPILLQPWGGDPPGWLVRLRNHLIKTKGEAAGYNALNRAANAVLGGLSCIAAAVVGGAARVAFGRRKYEAAEH